jgi:protein required for attachment to host cells
MTNKNHSITWVVVADNSQSKFYHITKFPKIEEISHLEHPESRLHNQDLVSSKPGRGFQSMGNARSSYQSKVEPKEQEAIKFAIQIADFLHSAHNKGEFHRLYIIAAPSFLGLLREHLNPETQKLVVAEMAKELTSCDLANIEHHISEIPFR